ncbi:MAG: helix-turn-helix domain-containing protein [Bacteroidales bacterium]|nr:helix-turn-helix domain-containing protein [Bacteroidales bacterium]
MTKKEFDKMVAMYGEIQNFVRTENKVKEIIRKLDQLTRLMRKLELYHNLTYVADMFEKQSWMLKEYMTINEAALYVGVNINTLRRKALDGDLAYYKPYNRVFFKTSELLEWIRSNKRMSVYELQENAERIINDVNMRKRDRQVQAAVNKHKNKKKNKK